MSLQMGRSSPPSHILITRLIIFLYSGDGIGRTSTFICIHAQLERIKAEGVIDIFQFVKSSRIFMTKLNLVSELVSVHYSLLNLNLLY